MKNTFWPIPSSHQFVFGEGSVSQCVAVGCWQRCVFCLCVRRRTCHVATMLFGTRVWSGIFPCFVVCAGVFFVATGGKCCGDFSSYSCHGGVRRSRSVRLNETIWKFVR